MSTVAVPVAVVATAGTSLSPVSATFCSVVGDIVAQLANTPTAPASSNADIPADLPVILIIFVSVERFAARILRGAVSPQTACRDTRRAT
jgi:hypothetical protein